MLCFKMSVNLKPFIKNSVFAYGATGSGKTHTMLGSAAEPGVMYLTMLDLFKCIDEIKEEKECSTAVSYLEVSSTLLNTNYCLRKLNYKSPLKLFYTGIFL
jgi:hypothetical protein